MLRICLPLCFASLSLFAADKKILAGQVGQMYLDTPAYLKCYSIEGNFRHWSSEKIPSISKYGIYDCRYFRLSPRPKDSTLCKNLPRSEIESGKNKLRSFEVTDVNKQLFILNFSFEGNILQLSCTRGSEDFDATELTTDQLKVVVAEAHMQITQMNALPTVVEKIGVKNETPAAESAEKAQ